VLSVLAGRASAAATGADHSAGIGLGGVADHTRGSAGTAGAQRPRVAGRARATSVGAARRVTALADSVDAAARGARLASQPAGSASAVAGAGLAGTVGAAARRARNAVAYAGAAHAVKPGPTGGRGATLAVAVRRTAIGRDRIAHHAGGAAGAAGAARARVAGSAGAAPAGAGGCVATRAGLRLTSRRASVASRSVAVVALLDRHAHDAVAADGRAAERHRQRHQLPGVERDRLLLAAHYRRACEAVDPHSHGGTAQRRRHQDHRALGRRVQRPRRIGQDVGGERRRTAGSRRREREPGQR